MKKAIAAFMLLVVGAACRDSALASSHRDANEALCAAVHGIPNVLLAYHHQKIDRRTAVEQMASVRREIEENASGRYGAHLRDVAAAAHVWEIVTMHRGDTSDAYRDLRSLRESLHRCRGKTKAAPVAH